MTTIDKSIPFPEIKRWNAGELKYPWRELTVGDSFLVSKEVKLSSMHAQCSRYGRQYGRKFRARKTEEGVRVWRVE